MGPPRPVNHGSKWRMKIEAGDGQAHSVNVQLPDRAILNDSYCRYITQQLFLAGADLDEVLDGWTPDRLRAHLEKQDPEALRAQVFAMRRRSG